MTLTYFTARSNLVTNAFLWEKVKTVDFSETIAACDLIVGRCRQLIEIMKVCEYSGQGHSFTIYFPGFVCFVLYEAKISGERLQDHWSSGYYFLTLSLKLNLLLLILCMYIIKTLLP